MSLAPVGAEGGGRVGSGVLQVAIHGLGKKAGEARFDCRKGRRWE